MEHAQFEWEEWSFEVIDKEVLVNAWAAVFTNDVPVPPLSDFSWLVGTTGDFFSYCNIGNIATCTPKQWGNHVFGRLETGSRSRPSGG